MPRLTHRLRSVCERGLPWLIDLLLPPSCPWCGGDSWDSPSGLLCNPCRQRFVSNVDQPCPRCGVFGRWHTVDRHGRGVCNFCRNERFSFGGVYPPLGVYRGELRQAIIRMKRAHERPLIWSIGRLWGSQLAAQAISPPDLITPVPRHWLRRIQTQQDVPTLLAESLGPSLPQSQIRPLLCMQRITKKQSQLARSARVSNLRRSMRLRHGVSVVGCSVAVVDDIMTTGATMNEAARTLLDAGAATVTVLVVARALSDAAMSNP